MAYTNFIAAIDLGTSRMVGVVGTKNAAGALSIIACDTEGSGDAIHRGCVYNIEETARRIRRLISKLENKLEGARIGKVYVGIGGQSLRSIEHNVSKLLGSEGVVTEEVLSSLRNECRKYHSDETVDVLAQESPIYFLDDKPVSNPLGLSGTRIEARYQLIVGRPSLRRNVAQSFERAKVGVAGYAIAPLVLADILLSARDKEQGCALIDLGAGTTSLAVYKHGNLINLSVVPLGGDLITKDIESLSLSAQEAERVKLTYGSAISDKADADMSLSSTGSRGTRISLRDLNNVIEAREREILENVCACLARIRMVGSLGAGVTITGGAANLKRLPEMVRDIFKMEVCYPSIRRELMADEEMAVNDSFYAVALGILNTGTENCAIPPKEEPKPEPKPEPEPESKPLVTPDTEPKPEPVPDPKPVEKKKKPREKKSGGLFGGLKEGLNRFTGTLFNENE